ncbi:hypothetical protein JCM18909_3168 [Cutibacterium acnes JCM 18909]|nr:hypothetical protein JCM18909_3168 [Cutibacterium acnes JCM 18909]
MHSHGEETPEEEISPQQVNQRIGALAPQDTVLGMVRQRRTSSSIVGSLTWICTPTPYQTSSSLPKHGGALLFGSQTGHGRRPDAYCRCRRLAIPVRPG